MELTMTNNFGFYELNENEMMETSGGWDGWQWLGGTACVVVGIGGAAASLIYGDVEGVITGIGIASYGVDNIYNSYLH